MSAEHMWGSTLGVQETNLGDRPRRARLPMLWGWKPSTSLSRLTASSTSLSLMCLGSGNWTSTPCILSSALCSATTCNAPGPPSGAVEVGHKKANLVHRVSAGVALSLSNPRENLHGSSSQKSTLGCQNCPIADNMSHQQPFFLAMHEA